jgi:two-component sensor histidine kinase/HAMP domain-containing protein
MQSIRNVHIKQKLTWIILLISGISLLVACIVLITYDQVIFKETMKRNLTTLAEIIGKNTIAALIFNSEEDASQTLGTLIDAKEYIDFACLYDKDDRVFARYRRKGVIIHTLPPIPKEEGCFFQNNRFIVFRPILLEGERIGKIYIQSNSKEMVARFKQYALVAMLVLVFAILMSYGLTYRMQRIVSDPILHLANVARDVSLKKDYSVRAEKFNQDELGFLTERFNEMLAQMQEHEDALQKAHRELERRAHELQKELTVRKRVERQIKKSLREKEILLKEIHHRVKNNLQIISSLLYFQSKKAANQSSYELFNESQNRIRSMALIHEKLYQSEDFANINFEEYIRSLASHLITSYGVHSHDIRIQIDAENVPVSIEKAIPCGLIINELISNSLKYAFPDQKEGEIQIHLKKHEKDIQLIVQDNGIGMSKNIDWETTETLGLRLVHTLVKQLSGSLEVRNETGIEFKIRFGR